MYSEGIILCPFILILYLKFEEYSPGFRKYISSVLLQLSDILLATSHLTFLNQYLLVSACFGRIINIEKISIICKMVYFAKVDSTTQIIEIYIKNCSGPRTDPCGTP